MPSIDGHGGHASHHPRAGQPSRAHAVGMHRPRRGLIHQPLRRRGQHLPRATDAEVMPKRPPRQAKKASVKQQPAAPRPERLSLEVSTHVVGTKDRTAVVRCSRARSTMSAGWNPSSTPFPTTWLRSPSRLEAVSWWSPPCLPRARAMAVFEEMGLKAIASRHRADEHAWMPLLESTAESLEDGALTVVTSWSKVGHPWSRPHVELCHRLGLTAPEAVGDLAGSAEPAMRFAHRR